MDDIDTAFCGEVRNVSSSPSIVPSLPLTLPSSFLPSLPLTLPLTLPRTLPSSLPPTPLPSLPPPYPPSLPLFYLISYQHNDSNHFSFSPSPYHYTVTVSGICTALTISLIQAACEAVYEHGLSQLYSSQPSHDFTALAEVRLCVSCLHRSYLLTAILTSILNSNFFLFKCKLSCIKSVSSSSSYVLLQVYLILIQTCCIFFTFLNLGITIFVNLLYFVFSQNLSQTLSQHLYDIALMLTFCHHYFVFLDYS